MTTHNNYFFKTIIYALKRIDFLQHFLLVR